MEILSEDASGQRLLEHLLPKLLGPIGEPHTWQIHFYRGAGRLPAGLAPKTDPAKRILLDQLPRLLRGYARTPGIDAVLVVLDADDRDCRTFLAELVALASRCHASGLVMFRLAIEEIEAWYLGDRAACSLPILMLECVCSTASPGLCLRYLGACRRGHPSGRLASREASRLPLPGQIKNDWADRIGPLLDPEANRSPSFRKLLDGIMRLAGLIPRNDSVCDGGSSTAGGSPGPVGS